MSPPAHHSIAPSILSADFTRIGAEVEAVSRAGAGLIHVDVMDGRFVPNLTVGPDIVSAVALATNLPLDVHLMIVEPDRLIPRFVDAGASIVTVHVEACPHLHRTIALIHDCGARAGVALNPATPLHFLGPVLSDIELVLIMTVDPGFGGQDPIPSALRKLGQARRLIDKAGLDRPPALEVDGGVKAHNAGDFAAADILVAGSGVFLWPETQEDTHKSSLDGDQLAAAYARAVSAILGALAP